jgi:DNA-binding beta-propeller fold protein YncE
MRTAKTLALTLVLILAPLTAHAQLMIIGNDDKITIDKTGKVIRRPPGKDSISVVDISSPEAPKIVANLPLMNSIVGPPTNLAITPDQKLAIVANAVDWHKEGDEWKQVPDNKLYVIDLTTSPPAHIATVDVGKQPSGLSINKAGNLALVANRADNSLPEGLVWSPDGKYLYVGNFMDSDVSILRVEDTKKGVRVVNTGKSLKLPGQPASMRGRNQ